MFRLWGKLWKDTRLLRDSVYEEESDDTRTHKVFKGIEKLCYDFDIEKPIWLDKNVREFQQHAKTSFYQDSFIEQVGFDYFEVHIIEEDGV